MYTVSTIYAIIYAIIIFMHCWVSLRPLSVLNQLTYNSTTISQPTITLGLGQGGPAKIHLPRVPILEDRSLLMDCACM